MRRNLTRWSGAAAAVVLAITVLAAAGTASQENLQTRESKAQGALKNSTKALKQLAATPAGRLALLADRLAADARDASPVSAHYVVASRRAANRVDNGDVVNLPDQTVYYVVVRGDFVGVNARIPPGKPPPTGTVMGFTVDPQTFDVLDYSLSDAPRDLGRFGHPTALSLP